MRFLRRASSLAVVITCCTGDLAGARTWQVRPDSTGDAPTIQAAIDSAATLDRVLVGPGVYFENIRFRGKQITVEGLAGADSTTIDGGGLSSVVWFEGGETPGTLLRGFTVTHGRSNGGGGIFTSSTVTSSPSISRCIIRENVATAGTYIGFGAGGGVFVGKGSPTFTNCAIDHNVAEGAGSTGGWGGGISISNQGDVLISDCVISENRALGGALGGGIHSLGHLTIVGCDIRGNSSGSQAGGIYSQGYDVRVMNCSITGNRAGVGGGGLQCADLDVLISNCTVADNSAPQAGGLLVQAQWWLWVTLEGSIIWGNCATSITDGSQVYLNIPASYQVGVRIGCCDIAPAGVYGAPTWLGGNISAEPLFCAPAGCYTAPTVSGDYNISTASSCANVPGCGLLGAQPATCDPTDVNEGAPDRTLTSIRATPNPFTDAVALRYGLAHSAEPVAVSIFDVRGRLLRTLRSGSSAGLIVWDGVGSDGAKTPAGIYFARVSQGQAQRTIRIARLR